MRRELRAENCAAADPGQYVEDSDKTQQLPCEEGTHSNTTAATECIMCVAGTFSDVEGHAECQSCELTIFPASVTSRQLCLLK